MLPEVGTSHSGLQLVGPTRRVLPDPAGEQGGKHKLRFTLTPFPVFRNVLEPSRCLRQAEPSFGKG